MTIDLTRLSAKELRSLISTAEKQQTKILTRPTATAMRSKINKYVKDHGYTIEELYGISSARPSGDPKRASARKSTLGRKLGKVAPKYRNPVNADETWTGRGKRPKWMAALVQNGKSPTDFLIR
ncbi:H-NS histone family protein [Stenotrophomonas maltophilia]|uniref:H-NS family nucleoid-associated regulatory protein n=1 Tax=Stenotrophomonas TaxID=40323 RepID=UPI0013DB34EF|nr:MULTISPECIES: H-NS histone family protein [Stenotrophomonas]EKT4087293.1 H-NS histone family protein [Stenotrophomonas maltophilia]MBH1536231.1 H-NS histone family protein [Stenotrophomonas maltophilia]